MHTHAHTIEQKGERFWEMHKGDKVYEVKNVPEHLNTVEAITKRFGRFLSHLHAHSPLRTSSERPRFSFHTHTHTYTHTHGEQKDERFWEMHKDDKVLELKSLPEHLNTVEAISYYFGRFGDVLNVWVCVFLSLFVIDL